MIFKYAGTSLIAAVTAMICESAFALNIPRGDRKADASGGFHEFEKHLAGYANVVVDAKGKAVVWAIFTSELKLQGSRNVSVNVEVWAGKEVVYGTHIGAHLSDAAFHGGHVRETRETKFSLTPEQWAKVTKIRYQFGARLSRELCAFYKKKYEEGNNHLDPQLTGCPH